MKYIDLRSDTVTQPTQAMREAMYKAEVGDDVYQDDPTTNELERRSAEVLGKEAALFVSSGTMGNQLAIMSQTQRGDEIIVGSECHIVVHEVGAAAVLSGVNLRALPFRHMIPSPAMIEAAIRPDDIPEPPTALICLENALANGRVVSVEIMDEVYRIARKHKIPVHLDGARVFNAAAALGVDVKEITKRVDTVNCCISKGLCAPVGAVLAGPKAVINRARKFRKMLGGGMRQNGILAAAGLIALNDMPARLHIDHENAQYLADKLLTLPGVTLDKDATEINMVFFDIKASKKTLAGLPDALLKKGIKISGTENGKTFRFVTNNGVSRADIDTVVDALSAMLA
jgi:threonine aldolase